MKSFGGHARERPRINMGGQRGPPQSREELLRRAEAGRQQRDLQRRKVSAAIVLQKYYRAHLARVEAMDQLRSDYDTMLELPGERPDLLQMRLIAYFFNPRKDVKRFLSLKTGDNFQSITNSRVGASMSFVFDCLFSVARDAYPQLDNMQHARLVMILIMWEKCQSVSGQHAHASSMSLLGMEMDRVSAEPNEEWNKKILEALPDVLAWDNRQPCNPHYDPAASFANYILNKPMLVKLPDFLNIKSFEEDRLKALCDTSLVSSEGLMYFLPSWSRIQPSIEWKLLNFAQLLLTYVLSSNEELFAWTGKFWWQDALAARNLFYAPPADGGVVAPRHWLKALTSLLTMSFSFKLRKHVDGGPDQDSLDEYMTSHAWLHEHTMPQVQDLMHFLASPTFVELMLRHHVSGPDFIATLDFLMAIIEFWPAEREQLLTQLALRALTEKGFMLKMFETAVSDMDYQLERWRSEQLLLVEICYRMYITMPDQDFFDPQRNPLNQGLIWGLGRLLNARIYDTAKSGAGSGPEFVAREAMAVRLLHHLVVRYGRQAKPDPLHWVLADHDTVVRLTECVLDRADEEADGDEDEEMEDSGSKPVSARRYYGPQRIMTLCPWTIKFHDRLLMLRSLIDRDAERSGFRNYWHQVSRYPVAVRREHELDDGLAVLWPAGSAIKQPLSIEYQDVFGMQEAGIDGGGLTKEFLLEACKQAFHPDRGLFVETADRQLHPDTSPSARTKKALMQYEFLGRLVGKCIYEGILIDASFAPFFLLKWIGKMSYLDDLQSLDNDLYMGLLKLKDYTGNVEEDLSLDFTLTETSATGTSTINLIPNGSDTPVTRANRLQYIHLVCHYKLNARYRKQAEAFVNGLGAVLNPKWLAMFSTSELQALIGGNPVPIDVAELKRNTQYGGFSKDDATVEIFWQCLEHRFTEDERRMLIKFVTSTPRPPLLGFQMLSPKFSIRHAGTDVARLPTASTCVNLLKLPEYRDADTLEQKLRLAITGHAGFDLS